jgi:hypothetical protein
VNLLTNSFSRWQLFLTCSQLETIEMNIWLLLAINYLILTKGLGIFSSNYLISSPTNFASSPIFALSTNHSNLIIFKKNYSVYLWPLSKGKGVKSVGGGGGPRWVWVMGWVVKGVGWLGYLYKFSSFHHTFFYWEKCEKEANIRMTTY